MRRWPSNGTNKNEEGNKIAVNDPLHWFSVRCLFKDSETQSYEERITLWRAHTFDEAISFAETEAEKYTEALDGVSYVGLAQGFSLATQPAHGSEIFSLIRDSDLDPNEYINTFFDTGTEHQGGM